MDRETYDRLVTDISNTYLNKDLEATHFAVNAVNNVLIAEGIEIPEPRILPEVTQGGERGWHTRELDGRAWIYAGDQPIVGPVKGKDAGEAFANAQVMVASKELVETGVVLLEVIHSRTCDEHLPRLQVTADFRDALEKAGADVDRLRMAQRQGDR